MQETSGAYRSAIYTRFQAGGTLASSVQETQWHFLPSGFLWHPNSLASPISLAPVLQHPGEQLPVCQSGPASCEPALTCYTSEDFSTIQWAATHPLCQGLSPSLRVAVGAVFFQVLRSSPSTIEMMAVLRNAIPVFFRVLLYPFSNLL